MIQKINKNAARKKRHTKIRSTVSGTAAKPRMNIYRSLSNIYVQFIDDAAGKTLAASSSLDRALTDELKGKNKKEQAAIVGAHAAKKVIALGITEAVFDRGGYLYTGRIKNIADGARSAGLKI